MDADWMPWCQCFLDSIQLLSNWYTFTVSKLHPSFSCTTHISPLRALPSPGQPQNPCGKCTSNQKPHPQYLPELVHLWCQVQCVLFSDHCFFPSPPLLLTFGFVEASSGALTVSSRFSSSRCRASIVLGHVSRSFSPCDQQFHLFS